jgi:hypothetical protein
MNPGKLFVSFWDICLDNLPDGPFRRRRITPENAKNSIEQARRENRLVGVSDDDLLAPYRQRERGKHDALRRVLEEQFGIALSFEDFVSKDETDPDGLCSIRPLSLVELTEDSQLLVVTCLYMLRNNEKHLPGFEPDPESVKFSVIEATNN